MRPLKRYTGLLLAGSLGLLTACSSTPSAPPPASDQAAGQDTDQDYGPAVAPDLSGLQEPVPRDVPRSRYGNPETYEVFGQSYQVMASMPDVYQEEGIASWYGKKFHGRRTSSGETYDMYAFTAAHRQLPIPVYVRVTHLENGRSIVVRVNDRGPFAHNRIIDLSYAAAQRLDMLDKGTAPVRIEILTERSAAIRAAGGATGAATGTSPGTASGAAVASASAARLPGDVTEEAATVNAALPSASSAASAASGPASAARYFLQVGAFSSQDNAQRLQRSLTADGLGPVEVNGSRDGPALYRVRLGPLEDEEALNSLKTRLQQRGLESTRVVITP